MKKKEDVISEIPSGSLSLTAFQPDCIVSRLNKLKSDWFDPHKSFFSLKPVRVVIGLIILFSIVVACCIINTSSLKWSSGYTGWNNALTIFKVPLGILALNIPIVALLAANHRSVQTKEQMRIANAQNVFTNYYRHLEEFEKYCKATSSTNRQAQVAKPRRLHKFIFPNAEQGDLEVSEIFSHSVDDRLSEIINAAHGLNSKNESEWKNCIFDMVGLVRNFSSEHYIDIALEQGTAIKSDVGTVIVPNGSVRTFIGLTKSAFQVVKDACLFDANYQPSELLESFTSFDISNLPVSKVSQFEPFNLVYVLNNYKREN